MNDMKRIESMIKRLRTLKGVNRVSFLLRYGGDIIEGLVSQNDDLSISLGMSLLDIDNAEEFED